MTTEHDPPEPPAPRRPLAPDETERARPRLAPPPGIVTRARRVPQRVRLASPVDPADLLPPELDENGTPAWQKLSAIVAGLLLIAALVIWRNRLSTDFWPIDRSSVGPNLLASLIQAAVVLVVAALIWPPTRRRIHRYISGHLAPIHARLETIEQKHDAHHAESIGRHDDMSARMYALERHLTADQGAPETEGDADVPK